MARKVCSAKSKIFYLNAHQGRVLTVDVIQKCGLNLHVQTALLNSLLFLPGNVYIKLGVYVGHSYFMRYFGDTGMKET